MELNNDSSLLNLNEKLLNNLFNSNQKTLINAYYLQNKKKHSQCIDTLENCAENFYRLGNIIDKLFIFPLILKDQREIISNNEMKFYNTIFNNKFLNKQERKFPPKKIKQHKLKWTEEEEKKFEEAIELYGNKSKFNNFFKLIHYKYRLFSSERFYWN